MKIQTGKLYSSYVNLLSLVKKYEDTVNNIQFCYNNISNYWKDGNTSIFFDKIELNKKNTQKCLLDLNDVVNLYKDIYYKYNELGNNIEYNLSNENIINNKIDRCISLIDKIRNKYLNLSNLNDYNMVSYDINENINLLNVIKDEFLNLKDKVNNISNKLKEIEKEISTRISKININYLKEDTLDDIR